MILLVACHCCRWYGGWADAISVLRHVLFLILIQLFLPHEENDSSSAYRCRSLSCGTVPVMVNIDDADLWAADLRYLPATFTLFLPLWNLLEWRYSSWMICYTGDYRFPDSD